MYGSDFDQYLNATEFINSNDAKVKEYAHAIVPESASVKEKVIALYKAVRDDVFYNPYNLILDPHKISASLTLDRKSGYCVEKSLLLAAVGRVHGIPSRLGFSIVKNHISTDKFVERLKSDKFVFHGYNEFWVDGKWVKCTPAFNAALCEKFGVKPLNFDGEHDSIFQEFTTGGQKYMEYLHEYGQFADFPYDLFVSELKMHYPHLFEKKQPLADLA
jgi:transglutaminase-like putative cysteine protease